MIRSPLQRVSLESIVRNVATQSFDSGATCSKEFFSTKNREAVIQRLSRLPPIDPKINSRKFSSNRRAAVLVPLIELNGEAAILFTVRSNHLSSHRGEVSFPGGAIDECDANSPINAAVRECGEEIGVNADMIDVWGELPPTFTRNQETIIYPVLALLNCPFNVATFSRHVDSMQEVRAVFARELNSLCDPKNLRFTQFRSGFSLPVFFGSDHRIWGLTAIILHQALRCLAPDLYHHAVRYVRPVRPIST